jgi:hypothetical protein
MIWVVHPGSGSRILILIFYPSQIPDSGVKRHRIRIRNTGLEVPFFSTMLEKSPISYCFVLILEIL